MCANQPTAICRSTLNYVARDGVEGGGTTEVTILDGRVASLPGWDSCGFELLNHSSAVTDWDDDAEIERVHHPEMAALARELTGCDHALVSSHIRRDPARAAKHSDLAPITFVHSDFADSYGDQIRERHRRPGSETEAALRRAGISAEEAADVPRLVILQFWRNLGPAKMDLPIAFCDARTVGRDDIRAFPVTNYADSGIDFEALGVVAPGRPGEHDWYAFPEMQRDEVVAFRTYDSDRVADGRPYWTPHSAFRDPDVPLGEPSRSSIELRATCLFTR